MSNKDKVLLGELEGLAQVGMVAQALGLADAKTANPISAIVDAMEAHSAGEHSVAKLVSEISGIELQTIDFFDGSEPAATPAQRLLDYLISTDTFLGNLETLGVITKLNREQVRKESRQHLCRAIEQYAAQYVRHNTATKCAMPAPRVTDEGRIVG